MGSSPLQPTIMEGAYDMQTLTNANTTMSINVVNRFNGIHCWPDAPEPVGFLRNHHHHLFVVYTQIDVNHDDRELEFLMVQRDIDKYIHQTMMVSGNTAFLGDMSCEQIAKRIIKFVGDKYGSNRSISVGVFEDDENGCWVTYAGDADGTV